MGTKVSDALKKAVEIQSKQLNPLGQKKEGSSSVDDKRNTDARR